MPDIVVYTRKDKFEKLLSSKQDWWLVNTKKLKKGDKVYFAHSDEVQGYFVYEDTGTRLDGYKPGALFKPQSWRRIKPVPILIRYSGFRYRWW